MTNEGQKQFILNDEEARQLADTCSTFCACYNCDVQTHMRLYELFHFVGPLPEAQEKVRRAVIGERECLDECLDLAARFGGWYKDMVQKIRSQWLADDIVKLFVWLKTHQQDELSVL